MNYTTIIIQPTGNEEHEYRIDTYDKIGDSEQHLFGRNVDSVEIDRLGTIEPEAALTIDVDAYESPSIEISNSRYVGPDEGVTAVITVDDDTTADVTIDVEQV